MKLDKNIKDEIKANSSEIQILLEKNEQLYRDSGVLKPRDSFEIELDVFETISAKIPTGFINNVADIINIYHLDSIVLNESARKNIAYSIEVLDLYIFFYYRFIIWGPVETMYLKNVLISELSIIEALIASSLTTLFERCKKCENHLSCENKVVKNDTEYLKKSIQKLKTTNAFNIDDSISDEIEKLYNDRNKVHILKSKDNEYKRDSITEKQCVRAFELIKIVADELYKSAVPKYNCCENRG